MQEYVKVPYGKQQNHFSQTWCTHWI